MTGGADVEVVVAHAERVTLRVGDTFVKVDGDPGRLEREVEAMALAPVPTAEVLWQRPSVLALGLLPGTPIARLGQPATTPPESWVAAGAALRRLHDAPPPAWSTGRFDRARLEADLEEECAWLLRTQVIDPGLVASNRPLAEAALRAVGASEVSFTHGDLQVAHVFLDDADPGVVTGVLDWSEAGPGDPRYDLAVLTMGHREHLADVLTGYDRDVDEDVVRGWWSYRSLTAIRWLAEHGFDPDAPGCEIDVLRAQA